MLKKDAVAARLNSDAGISYTEFSYQILQGLDYLELYRQYDCVLQTGGSDQWGNLTAGVELIRRSDGARVHALATPLLTKADGTKFGKTESGTVWLDPAMTSPYAFHQFFLNAEDTKVVEYLKVFSERSRDELDELAARSAEAPHLRIAQRALADDVTDLVHSPTERMAATDAAQALFGRGDLSELPERTLLAVAGELNAAEVQAGAGLPTVVDALEASGVVATKSAARRAIAEGGAYVNNAKVTDAGAQLSEHDVLAGGVVVLRRGRRTVGALKFV